MTFKTLTLLARRPDLTREEFIRRYETGHSKLGERLLRGSATRYVRRYIEPQPGSEAGEHDVVMEIWYPDRATWAATMEKLSDPAVRAEIAEDEETLFDRAKNRFFLVEEHESEM